MSPGPCSSATSGASASDASSAASCIDPQALVALPDAVREGIVTAHADALAPVFWYPLPFIGIASALSPILKQIPLSGVAGLVAYGEAIGGDDVEALEAAERSASSSSAAEEAEGSDLVSDRSNSGSRR